MKRQFDYIGSARIWIILSVIVTLLGLVSLAVRGLNLGIDYTGGTQMLLVFEQPDLTVQQVHDAVARELGKTPTVKATELGEQEGAAFLVTTEQLDAAGRERLMAAIETSLGKPAVESVSEVSGSIRSELIMNALLAVAIASVLQVIYITIRFEFRFALSAVVALLHDAIMTLGLVSLLGLEVGPPFLAAVLTLIGYSVNDTIVVYDRIRENLRRRNKGESLQALVNRSISETVVRSISTGLCTMISIVAIMIWGGESTRDFAVTLLIGLISGTYSSIFIASPLWLWWRKRDAAGKEGAPALAGR